MGSAIIDMIVTKWARSLAGKALRSQRRGLDMPSWMNDDDLKSGYINFSLEGTMAKYFREWDEAGAGAI